MLTFYTFTCIWFNSKKNLYALTFRHTNWIEHKKIQNACNERLRKWQRYVFFCRNFNSFIRNDPNIDSNFFLKADIKRFLTDFYVDLPDEGGKAFKYCKQLVSIFLIWTNFDPILRVEIVSFYKIIEKSKLV